MNRFRCLSRLVTGMRIVIDDPAQLHHLKVLRLDAGEKVGLFDERGNEYECTVAEVAAGRAVFDILKALPPRKPAAASITVAVAIPKKSKIDDIIDKLTQVGVDRVIPLVTERVIVRPSARDMESRLIRWRKVAEAAVMQSQRNSAPRVDAPTEFDSFIAQCAGFDLKLIPTLGGERKGLKEVLSAGTPQSVVVLIGPEGDFSPAETARAMDNGFVPVSFGANVLRVETAAVYIASVLAYEFHL